MRINSRSLGALIKPGRLLQETDLRILYLTLFTPASPSDGQPGNFVLPREPGGGGHDNSEHRQLLPPCTEGKTEVAEDAAEGSAINRAAENLKYISVLFWR